MLSLASSTADERGDGQGSGSKYTPVCLWDALRCKGFPNIDPIGLPGQSIQSTAHTGLRTSAWNLAESSSGSQGAKRESVGRLLYADSLQQSPCDDKRLVPMISHSEVDFCMHGALFER